MDRINTLYLSKSVDETFLIAQNIAKQLTSGDILALSGNLGSGKTQFAKGLISYLCQISINEITSPTFTYLNIYDTPNFEIYHFDLYRIADREAFIKMGFDDFLYKNGICLIEWPEKIQSLLPRKTMTLSFVHKDECQREISFMSFPK